MDKTIIEIRRIDDHALMESIRIDDKDDFEAAVAGLVSVLFQDPELERMVTAGLRVAHEHPGILFDRTVRVQGTPWENK